MRKCHRLLSYNLAFPTSLLILLLSGMALKMGQGGVETGIDEMSLTLFDQLGRSTPFFVTNANSTDNLTATFVLVISEGSMMPFPGATFEWLTPRGDVVAEVYGSFVFVGARTFMSRSTLEANLSTFPPDLRTYSVTASAGEHRISADFHICGRVESKTFDEDFTDDLAGQPSAEWDIVAPGYGVEAQWIEELTYENKDHVLRMMSYFNKPAILSRGLNLSHDHVSFGFQARIWEETVANNTDQIAMSFGIDTTFGRLSLLQLGRSDVQEVLFFGHGYPQNIWLQFEIFLDMGSHSSTSAIYMDGTRIGLTKLPPIQPEEIRGIYFELGGGAHYVGQFDDILVEEFDLIGGYPDRPVRTSIIVTPSHGQRFDPSSFVVTILVDVTPCILSNQYLAVGGLVIELWNSTQYLGMIGRTSWNVTGSYHSPCQVFRHSRSFTIPANLILDQGQGIRPYAGEYTIKLVPDNPDLSLLAQSSTFRIQDAIDAYFSYWRAGNPVRPPIFQAQSMNLSICIELDPESKADDENEPFINKRCRISWINPEGEPIKKETVMMRTHESYPSEKSWVFSDLELYENSIPGTYECYVTAVCNSGFEITDRFPFTVLPVCEAKVVLIASLILAPFVGLAVRMQQSSFARLKT